MQLAEGEEEAETRSPGRRGQVNQAPLSDSAPTDLGLEEVSDDHGEL